MELQDSGVSTERQRREYSLASALAPIRGGCCWTDSHSLRRRKAVSQPALQHIAAVRKRVQQHPTAWVLRWLARVGLRSDRQERQAEGKRAYRPGRAA